MGVLDMAGFDIEALMKADEDQADALDKAHAEMEGPRWLGKPFSPPGRPSLTPTSLAVNEWHPHIWGPGCRAPTGRPAGDGRMGL
jgi:hypothetical protein